jgi:hypothetical protein
VPLPSFYIQWGRGYKESLFVGYNCSSCRTLSLVFLNYKFNLTRVGLHLYEIFYGRLVFMWAYGDTYMGLLSYLSHVPLVCVDIVSSDILSRNGKSVTMQDQSRGRTRRVFRLVRALRRVKPLRPVLMYYEV